MNGRTEESCDRSYPKKYKRLPFADKKRIAHGIFQKQRTEREKEMKKEQLEKIDVKNLKVKGEQEESRRRKRGRNFNN